MQGIIGVFGILLIGFVYFCPTILAKHNKSPRADGILLLNLLLGWTFIGWVVALVWAASDKKEIK